MFLEYILTTGKTVTLDIIKQRLCELMTLVFIRSNKN